MISIPFTVALQPVFLDGVTIRSWLDLREVAKVVIGDCTLENGAEVLLSAATVVEVIGTLTVTGGEMRWIAPNGKIAWQVYGPEHPACRE